MNKSKILTIVSALGLYLLISGASYIGFTKAAGKSGQSQTMALSSSSPNPKSRVDLTAPKTEECPLNGEKYTVAERKLWETKRPIAIMVENSTDARPQSGFSKSDVVYEAVAEGGVTRFMGIFYCGAQSQDTVVAPVRSSRIYFIKLAQEYGNQPIYAHIGGANAGAGETNVTVRALEYLETIKWRIAGGNDFDTTFDSGYPTFWRDYERLDHEVATEHTMSTSTDKIWAQAAKRNLTNVDATGQSWAKNLITWKYVDDAAAADRGTTSKISFGFWTSYSDYSVDWTYDKNSNSYSRANGGKASVDHENNEPITAKNVVIEFVTEKGPLDEHLHMWYGVEGTGKAKVFQNGNVIEATWSKIGPTSRTTYTDIKTGKEIPLVRGRIWVEIVPKDNKVDVI